MKFDVHLHSDQGTNRALAELLKAVRSLGVNTMAMFDDLGLKVKSLTDAADAMDMVLQDVKKRLDDLLATGSLLPADAAALTAISTAIDTESAKLISDTLANTPAAVVP